MPKNGMMPGPRPADMPRLMAGSDGPAATIVCPATAPEAGAPCAGQIGCSYGDSARPDCRDVFVCSTEGSPSGAFAWRRTRGACPAAPVGFCPAGLPAEGSECSPIDDPNKRVPCAYAGDILCSCPCRSLGNRCARPERWVCVKPPTTPGCPAVAPNWGASCPVQGVQCRYGDPCGGGGAVAFCRAGVWEQGNASCL